MSDFPFRAVLFDFDGTLADGYGAIAQSVNFVRAGYGLAPVSEAEVRQYVGRGLRELIVRINPDGDAERDIQRYRAYYADVMIAGTRLLPGVVELLRDLGRREVRLGLCSNKSAPFTKRLLEGLGIAAYFGAVRGPEDVPRPKPAPDMLLAAAERLGAVAPEVLYVGDMTVDVKAARAADMAVWVVVTGSQDRKALAAARPDRLFDNLRALHKSLPFWGTGA